MKLEDLSVENIKGIKRIDLNFETLGHAVVIAGKNGAGKSSLIDAVQYLFAGARAIPDDVIRHGAREGEISATLEDGTTIEKKFTPKGMRITVKDGNGVPVKAPQTILNKLIEGENGGKALLFDPNKFATLPSKEMLEMLKSILNIDTTEIDKQYETIYTERTELNRDLKKLKARREAIKVPTNIPEHNLDALLAERKRRQEVIDTANKRKLELQLCRENIKRLEEQLNKEREREKELMSQGIPIIEPVEQIDEMIAQAQKAAEDMALARQAAELDEEILAAEQAVEEHNDVLEAIKKTKQDMLSKVEQIPIPGLAVTEDGLTINGVTPENLSQGEKLRLGINAALAMQPELKILLVRDASLLDEDSLNKVIEDAKQHDTTILLEIVSGNPNTAAASVYITEGEWIKQKEESEKEARELEAALA